MSNLETIYGNGISYLRHKKSAWGWTITGIMSVVFFAALVVLAATDK